MTLRKKSPIIRFNPNFSKLSSLSNLSNFLGDLSADDDQIDSLYSRSNDFTVNGVKKSNRLKQQAAINTNKVYFFQSNIAFYN